MHINECRDFILGNPAFRNAFCLSPDALAYLATLNMSPGVQEPMGFCAEVNKVGIRRDDVKTINFFYL